MHVFNQLNVLLVLLSVLRSVHATQSMCESDLPRLLVQLSGFFGNTTMIDGKNITSFNNQEAFYKPIKPPHRLNLTGKYVFYYKNFNGPHILFHSLVSLAYENYKAVMYNRPIKGNVTIPTEENAFDNFICLLTEDEVSHEEECPFVFDLSPIRPYDFVGSHLPCGGIDKTYVSCSGKAFISTNTTVTMKTIKRYPLPESWRVTASCN